MTAPIMDVHQVVASPHRHGVVLTLISGLQTLNARLDDRLVFLLLRTLREAQGKQHVRDAQAKQRGEGEHHADGDAAQPDAVVE
jgi:hypothetical protein